MKLKIYSIYDKVAEVFNKPFTDINDASAIRSFKQSVQEQPHKNDYELHYIGEFYDHNGVLTSTKDNPKRLISGFDIKNNVEEIEIERIKDQFQKNQNEEKIARLQK